MTIELFRLPTFIENFLADRAMQVRVGSSLSDYYDQEQGVPQGGEVSTTLFSIKINDIVKCLLGNLTDCSLYVDDFCICYRSKSMATIERQLQQNLNKIENWATSNGFKFSKSKTQCVHFCQLRKQHDDPVLHLYGSPIPVVEESKFLGILFDRKLSFIPHIKYLKAKCLKALNLLKVLSHTSWGADRTTLLKLYRSLVRSKLDYCCIIYGSARKSYLQMLDPMHNQGLRLDSSIFTAEAKAVDLALDFISTCDANNKFIIFSDSLSVLKAMNHTSSKNPQIQKLLEKCHERLAYKEIVLCWIPSHIGIQGNEIVDNQAKTSLSLEPTSFKISFSNFKPSINKYILEEWQTLWNNSIGNKLLDIKPTIGEYQSVVRNIRKEEVVLARLSLGHTRVTHSYLLQGEEQPQCVGCDAPFTVRQFLLECGDFAQVRNNCFHVDNMKELFQYIHIDSIMTF